MYIIIYIPLYGDLDSEWANAVLCLLDECEEAAGDGGPLDRKGSQQEVESNATETIATQESHEKSKADECHNVDILKDCGERYIHTYIQDLFLHCDHKL